ncbi:MAG: UbiX family flavin prenyltransferase [Methanomicrobiales archaeon]|nr:UbiX family flavin prenyltransferase [Methanomicrobiales archaeon]
MAREFVVGVTGASGAVYAQRLLEVLCDAGTVHLIISQTAWELAAHEGVDFEGFSATYYDNNDLSAPIASGSSRFERMVVLPCSMKTLAAIAHGYSSTLIARAADVSLKERRRPILVMREMPLSRVHLKNMLTADESGAVVMVASPAFYHHPRSVQDMVDMVVARVLDHLDVPHTLGMRWSGYDA